MFSIVLYWTILDRKSKVLRHISVILPRVALFGDVYLSWQGDDKSFTFLVLCAGNLSVDGRKKHNANTTKYKNFRNMCLIHETYSVVTSVFWLLNSTIVTCILHIKLRMHVWAPNLLSIYSDVSDVLRHQLFSHHVLHVITHSRKCSISTTSAHVCTCQNYLFLRLNGLVSSHMSAKWKLKWSYDTAKTVVWWRMQLLLIKWLQ